MTKKLKRSDSNSSDGKQTGGDYEVGYGKPPKGHQFKPGQSGNPRGRPKGAKSEETVFRGVAARKVAVTEAGKIRKVDVTEAMWTRVADDGLKGNSKSQTLFLNRARALEAAEPEDAVISPDDEKVLKSYRRHVEAELRSKAKAK